MSIRRQPEDLCAELFTDILTQRLLNGKNATSHCAKVCARNDRQESDCRSLRTPLTWVFWDRQKDAARYYSDKIDADSSRNHARNRAGDEVPPSSEAYDRGTKFEWYKSIPSFAEYLLVAQDRAHVTQRTRQPDGSWLERTIDAPAAEVQLSSIACELPLTEIYEVVEF